MQHHIPQVQQDVPESFQTKEYSLKAAEQGFSTCGAWVPEWGRTWPLIADNVDRVDCHMAYMNYVKCLKAVHLLKKFFRDSQFKKG